MEEAFRLAELGGLLLGCLIGRQHASALRAHMPVGARADFAFSARSFQKWLNKRRSADSRSTSHDDLVLILNGGCLAPGARPGTPSDVVNGGPPVHPSL